MLYTLGKDTDFAPFLKPDASWQKLTATTPNRGLHDDVRDNGLKKEAKVQNLNNMFRRLCQWVPHYLASDILNESTCMESIWQVI